MDIGNLLGGAGVLLGSGMAGAGALKMFLAAAHAVERIPSALERAAHASERQATAIESSASVAVVLHDLRDGQEQIRISVSVLAQEIEELRRQGNG